MRTLAVLAACLLGTVAAAGCLSDAAGTSLAPASLDPRVDGSDAELVAVVALEVTDAATVRDTMAPPDWLAPWLERDDATPGDGQATAWAFIHRQATDAEPTYEWTVVDDDGASDPTPLPAGLRIDVTGPALPATWNVDAPQAAQAAADAEPTWADIADDAPAYVLSYLVHHVDKRGTWGPTWFFEAGALDGPQHAVAAVNASSGQPRPVGVVDPFSPAATVEGTVSGSVDTGTPTQHTLTVDTPGHKKLKFVLDVPSPGNNFDVVAAGPDGQEFVFYWNSGNGQARWQTFDVGPGEWTLTVTLNDGETQDYTIHWCAVGATPCHGA